MVKCAECGKLSNSRICYKCYAMMDDPPDAMQKLKDWYWMVKDMLPEQAQREFEDIIKELQSR